MSNPLGELVPLGGGDAIPLVRPQMSLGRRDSCDINLKFSNVSSNHCEFNFTNGLWYVRDLGSANGTKVNGERVVKKLLRPGDQIGISGHKFTIEYKLSADAKGAMEEQLSEEDNVFGTSLMEKAGLTKPKGRE